jgi:predicted methyltransferase
MRPIAWLFAASLLVTACKKDEAASTPPAGANGASASSGAAIASSETEKVAAQIAKNAEEAKIEKARWTPALEKAALALRDRDFKDTAEALTAFLSSDHRGPGHKDRDAARHPVETLAFFGVTPGSTVIEMGAGDGWYTELLAPLLGKKGKLIVLAPSPDGPADKMSTAYGKSVDALLAKSALFDKVERLTVVQPLSLGKAGVATHVLAIRELHNWQRRGELDEYLAAIHAALTDGGTFGVVAHRAKPGTNGEDTAASGYLAEAWVIAKVEAAGFKLAEKSEVNANPKDTKDYPKGVWTLPPNLAEGDTDKAKYVAIGESDRMTLRFTKVAEP